MGKGRLTEAECLNPVCRHRWSVRPNNVRQGASCPRCAKAKVKKPIPLERRLQEAEAVGVRYIELPRKANDRVLVECLACKRRWLARPAMFQSGSGCRVCADAANGKRKRAARHVRDEQAAQVGLRWLEDPVRAHDKFEIECVNPECRARFRARPNDVQQGARCPECSEQTPFSSIKPSRVYLLRLDRGPLIKVGVMNSGSRRIATHIARGWEVLGSWDVPTGRDALDIEAAVQAYWHRQHAVRCNREDVPAGDGYSESVWVGRATEPETMRFIERAVEEMRSASTGE